MRDLELLQEARLGTPVTGKPTRLREAIITSLNKDGTVAARSRVGRKVWEGLPVPSWYGVAVGDLVLVANIDGSSQRPIVICPVSTKANSAPQVTSGFSGEVPLAKLTEAGKQGKLVVSHGLITSVVSPS